MSHIVIYLVTSHLPVEHVLAHGAGGALRGRVPAEVLQLLVDALQSHAELGV